MNRRSVASLVVAIFLVCGIAACSEPKDNGVTLRLEGGPSTSVPKAKADKGLSDKDIDRLADEAFGRMGFESDEVVTGKDVEFEGADEERGDAAFSKETLRTRADVVNFLKGGSPEKDAARKRVAQALMDQPEELYRAANGEGYVPIQFKVAVQYFGTTYFSGEDVIVAGDPRRTGENDILWLFVTKDGVIIPGASIRADCGNPHFTRIIPIRPETPPAPPIEQPPACPPGMHGTPPICKDGGERDPEPQGNNRPGGGGHAPPITGPATAPQAGNPPTTYVSPTPPAPTTTPRTSVPPSEGPPPETPVPPDPTDGTPPCNPLVCSDDDPGVAA